MISWIIDVGAYDGTYGKIVKKVLSDEQCRILYIEPDPEAFERIVLDEGDLKLNLAVASYDGTIPFYFYQPGTHSVLQTNAESIRGYVDGFSGKQALAADWVPRRVSRVPCRRLDSVISEYGIQHVRFLKVDAQGYDLEVIKSLGDSIDRVDEVVCEVQVTPREIYKNASKKEDVIDYLHSVGFLFLKQEFQTFGQEINMYFKKKSIMRGFAKEPLVSVLTPSYNNANFIKKCIESVLAQDYPHVEMIVQDGGSTDGTVEILKRYSGRIDWRSEKDHGQSDGLNRALQRCRGDIIGVLNADDEYLPHAARWAVDNFAIHPEVGGIYGQQHNVDAKGNILWSGAGPDPYDFEKVFCCEAVIPAQAAFVRRTVFETAGFYVDVTRKTCPDYEMWVRIGLKASMRYVPGFVAKYRIHPGSEGQNDKWVEEFVRSKRAVIERICNDLSVPVKIRSLRRRAHAGVFALSALHFMLPIKYGKNQRARRQLMKSFIIRPTSSLFFDLFLASLFPTIDLSEKKVMINRAREKGRELDERFFGGVIYRFLYRPAKGLLTRMFVRDS